MYNARVGGMYCLRERFNNAMSVEKSVTPLAVETSVNCYRVDEHMLRFIIAQVKKQSA